MSRLKNTIIQIHNLSGTFLSLMFVIWFLSGFVLIYAGFPHASRKERYMYLSSFNKSDFDSIQAPPPTFSGKVELEKLNGHPVYRVYIGRKAQKIYNAITLEECAFVTEQEAIDLAEDFSGAKLASVEKIKELDQWMPWSYYRPLLPFYKCSMDDDEHTRIYISAKSGIIVQETKRKSRWLARIGAIPHWIYFKSLRLNVGLWRIILICISSLGLIVSLSGLIAGFIRLRKKRKNESLSRYSPYRKFWHKWHHITGFVFGLFVFTFILSGLVSLTDIPNWMVAVHAKKSAKKTWNQKLDAKQHSAVNFSDLWAVIEGDKPVRKVALKTVMNQPCYWVYRDQLELPEVYILSKEGIQKKAIYSKAEIETWRKHVYAKFDYDLKSLTKFDAYYQKSGMWERPLPVWLLNLDDSDKTSMYINPDTGVVQKSYNTNDRWRRWLYRSLHTLDFPFLKEHDWLRKSLLIFLSIGGTLVSLSGLVLGIKWMRRKRRHSKSQGQ
jgi:hypothetical protein